ncbi:MAG TPA: PilZ domain-containing protein [Solirubrobacteraceae bacterium]
MSQRREFVRLKGNRPVLVYVGKDRRPIRSYTVDLAGGGLLLAGPDVLEVGEDVEFQLMLAPESPPIVGVGTVVRSDVKGHRAITFSEMSEVNRRRVVRFIFASERAERRRMLEANEPDSS